MARTTSRARFRAQGDAEGSETNDATCPIVSADGSVRPWRASPWALAWRAIGLCADFRLKRTAVSLRNERVIGDQVLLQLQRELDLEELRITPEDEEPA